MTTAAAIPRSAGRKQALRIAGSVLPQAALALFFPRHKLVEALASIRPATIAAAPEPSGLVSGTISNPIIDLAALALLLTLSVLAGLLPNRDRKGAGAVEQILQTLVTASILACTAVFLLRRKLTGSALKYLTAFTASWRRPWLTLAVLALSLAMQTGLIVLSAWLGVGCGLHLPARAWLFAWPLAKLSGFVPVTLAGIGSRELVLPALLAPFGADPGAAASVGLARDAVLITGCLAGGAISKLGSLAHTK